MGKGYLGIRIGSSQKIHTWSIIYDRIIASSDPEITRHQSSFVVANIFGSFMEYLPFYKVQIKSIYTCGNFACRVCQLLHIRQVLLFQFDHGQKLVPFDRQSPTTRGLIQRPQKEPLSHANGYTVLAPGIMCIIK